MTTPLTRDVYIDLGPTVGTIISRLEDPSSVGNGPPLIPGSVVPWRLYFGYVIARTYQPLDLPSAYTVKVSARRTDNPDADKLLDEVAATAAYGTNGNPCHQVNVATTAAAWETTLAVPDAERNDGVRITFQVTIAAGDASEVYRLQFISILRPAI